MTIVRNHDRASRAEGRRLARARASGNDGPVNTGLDHLPEGKRAELAFVVETLRTAFDAARSSRSKEGILKIILFGSYARGDWVEDPVGRYFSDYDLLIVVGDEKYTSMFDYWDKAEQQLLEALAEGKRLRTPVGLIVHDIADVNHQLARGRYFFTDILRDGVVLFEEPGHPFDAPQPLARETALTEAQGYYEDWIPGAAKALKGARFYIDEGDNKDAAFLLHQATERLYNGLLLVTTLYTPKSHNLVRLRGLVEQAHPELAEVWPGDSKFHRRCFELLRAAYVKARYSRHYKVNAEELAWMVERIELLQARVVAICEARLAELAAG